MKRELNLLLGSKELKELIPEVGFNRGGLAQRVHRSLLKKLSRVRPNRGLPEKAA